MSLHTLANHLQSAGRGEDKVLVHMTPKEVDGLQSLAMAHGGSLTINPQTGLPEAGFLSSLLPMIAGFALGPAGLGLTAMQAGLTTAAIGAASTGSLTKGLMAGLGAYSGAGLGAGLQAMAAPAVPPAGVYGTPAVSAVPTSTLAGTSPLAKVGAEDILTSADDLMGIKPGVYDPRTSSVFVKNGSVVAPSVSNVSAPPINAINENVRNTILKNPVSGVYTPSAATSPSVVEVVPESVAVKPPRADAYFDSNYNSYNPVKDSGFGSRTLQSPRANTYFDSKYDTNLTPIERSGFGIRGGAAQKVPDSITSDIYGTAPKVNARLTSDVASGAFKDPNAVRSGVRTIEVDDFVPVEVNAMPNAPVSRGLSGVPPERLGPFDRAQFGSRAVPSNQTVVAGSGNAKPAFNQPAVAEKVSLVRPRQELLPGGEPIASPRSLSGPFTDRMAELGRGAKASFSSLEGLKGLHAASEAAAPYGTYAGLGSTAYNLYEEKRQRMEDEARAREAAQRGLIRPYEFTYGTNISAQPYYGSAERTYFQPSYTELEPYKAPGPEYAASGGLMGYAVGGSVEQMSAQNAIGSNTGYPMANITAPMYSNPMTQRPEAMNVLAPTADTGVGAYSGEMRFARGGHTAEPESSGYSYSYDPTTMQFTQTSKPQPVANRNVGYGMGNPNGQGYTRIETRQQEQRKTTPNGTVSGGIATPVTQSVTQPADPAQSFIPNIDIPAYQTPEQQLGLGGFYDYMNQQLRGYGGYAAGGGISHLGDYSDGGRLLKGPGDGVSDSIPASIGNRQPARLADGEFVVPARIVSEIGNGSTEAGARKLYAMMDRVQRARRKTVGKGQVARNTKAEKLLPA